MESIASIYKEEDDIFYRIGEQQGFKTGFDTGVKIERERKNTRFVTNLLTKTNISIEMIAEIVEVSIDFVLKVKAAL